MMDENFNGATDWLLGCHVLVETSYLYHFSDEERR